MFETKMSSMAEEIILKIKKRLYLNCQITENHIYKIRCILKMVKCHMNFYFWTTLYLRINLKLFKHTSNLYCQSVITYVNICPIYLLFGTCFYLWSGVKHQLQFLHFILFTVNTKFTHLCKLSHTYHIWYIL